MSIHRLKALLYMLLFLGFCVNVNAQKNLPSFKKYKKSTHKIKADQAYTFGYLSVAENRNDPKSKIIKLPVYIFKSRSDNPKRDPIIYTVGGPGSSTMPSAQYMKYYKYLDDRDFILIEQRGTYYSKPCLNCPEWSEAIYQSNLPGVDSSQYSLLLETAVRECRNRLSKKKIDLDSYNTNEIAADINDLVEVLELEEYNLLTISYSTKIAQVLMRDYPDKIRSVVMDSPLPLDVNYDEESIKNLMETFDVLLTDCEQNEDCNRAFPNIKENFLSFLREKSDKPMEIVVKNPNNGNLESFYLNGSDFIMVFSLSSTLNVLDVPFEINKILNDDLSSVKEYLSTLFNKKGKGSGMGMRLSVWCAEEFPFCSQEIIESEKNKYPELGTLSPALFSEEICRIWSVTPLSKIENQAVKSDIPTLLISGSYDETTPVKWATNMKNNLSKSHHLIFDGWKHIPTTNWEDQCAMEAANEFFNAPGKKPNPKCLMERPEIKFRTE